MSAGLLSFTVYTFLMRKEPGRNIPYVIGAIAMLIYWPFAIGFSLTSMLALLPIARTNTKIQTAIAILAFFVGMAGLILAGKYLGYDIASGYGE